MIIAITLITVVGLLYASVYYRQEAKRLEHENKHLANLYNFAQADADTYLNSFNAACNRIDALENTYVFTDEPITEIDGTLLQDNTDPTREEYWNEPCEADAFKNGYTFDDDGNLIAPQSADEFVSDITDAIDSIKWTSQDGE